MKNAKSNRGGVRNGAGRKPLAKGETTVVFPLRLPESQRDKLERLGGAKWLRERIKRAKELK